MREEIADIILAWLVKPDEERIIYELIDGVTGIIGEEIEKVENPYGYWGKVKLKHWEQGQQEGFKFCRQKILSLLKE